MLGLYPYTADLLGLSKSHPSTSPKEKVIQEKLSETVTPLQFTQWEALLADHPDRTYVDYILAGIREGFRIGFAWDEVASGKLKLSSARKNMRSAEENAQTVRDYLQAEKRRGFLLGPFCRSEVPTVHLSRFGVIPKSNRPGKWRLIVDLSHPEGKSVNDGISPDLCSLQ